MQRRQHYSIKKKQKNIAVAKFKEVKSRWSNLKQTCRMFSGKLWLMMGYFAHYYYYYFLIISLSLFYA
jgi:hypothetical protein